MIDDRHDRAAGPAGRGQAGERAGSPELGVVVAGREDRRPPDEAPAVAALADELGYRRLWVGESGPTWDGFVLATAIGRATHRITMTVGPVPVSVRDPATIARAAASVTALIGRPVGVALGTSSLRMVEGVHGRSRSGAVAALEDAAARTARALRDADPDGRVRANGFAPRLPAAGGELTVAAFGEQAIAVAARHADRMLVDLVAPDQVRALRATLTAAARDSGTRPPRLAAWLPAAVDPTDAAYTQILESIAGYLSVHGYAETFTAAGYGLAVERARAGATLEERVAALPREAAHMIGLVGDADSARTRLRDYADAGLDEIAILPTTSGDNHGRRTLTALAPGIQ